MNTTSPSLDAAPAKKRNWFGSVVSVASVTLVCCGSMYLAGYWRYYRINFLDYISVSEVVARSIFDVVPVIAMIVTFAIITLLIFSNDKYVAWIRKKEEEAKAKLKPGDWRLDPVNRKMVLPGFSLLIIVFCFVYWWAVDGDYVNALVCALPFFSAVLGSLFSDIIYPKIDMSISWLAFFLVGMMPTACFIRGELYAEKRLEGPSKYECEFVVRTVPEVEESRETIMPDYVYAGRMGGFAFLASKSKQATLVIPESRILFLDVYKKKSPEEIAKEHQTQSNRK